MASPPPPPSQQAETLMSLISSLSSSLAALSSHSKSIPTSHDFHFYNNFPHFNTPIQSLSSLSASILASSGVVPSDDDDDEKCLDAVVDANDGLIERFGAAVDEFEAGRRKREEAGGEMEKDGFQLVRGRKKRNGKESGGGGGESEVRVVVKPKVPFHMPGIPKPQDQYNILVNNQNVPFQHVWLETSKDGERFVHPLERLSVSSFIDKDNEECIPTKPLPLEDTPFKLVESVNDLRELANKLRDSNEFAIDLEHNQYRSFQGLTCLMQISTRTEDFIVDTLKLRIHVGPHLREVFKDPSKRKVIHGADRDILWLERDFGIYICNMFDTGQASRVLQLERNSLEYLLRHYCDVAANKEYQNADWRLRPLPDEMIKYAREDTHYLLYIYDVMRNELLSKPNSENGSAIMEVYMRSYDICMQLYEKELLTDTSYLHIYGLREEAFTSEQLAVAAGLCEWRDGVARAEDESTGYVLPNRVLLEIARKLPLTSGKLRRLVKSKHTFLERHLGQVLNIIKSSIKNAPAFECIAEQLKKEHFEALVELNGQAMCVDSESPEVIADQDRDTLHTVLVNGGNTRSPNLVADDQKLGGVDKISFNHLPVQNLQSASTSFQCISNPPSDINGPNDEDLTDTSSGAASLKSLRRVNVASVQKLQRPSGAFGALLGNSKKKPSMDLIKTRTEQVKSEKRLEQIKSSVSLPFHSFSGLKLTIEEVQESKPITSDFLERQQHDSCVTNINRETEEVIMIGSGLSDSETDKELSVADDHLKNSEHFEVNGLAGDEDVSFAEVTFGFEKCSSHSNSKISAAGMSSKLSPGKNQVQPFNYAAARKQMNFAGDEEGQGVKGNPKRKTGSTGNGSKSSAGTHKGEAQGSEFQQPRRRQAFPASGNRSATFR